MTKVARDAQCVNYAAKLGKVNQLLIVIEENFWTDHSIGKWNQELKFIIWNVNKPSETDPNALNGFESCFPVYFSFIKI